MVNIVCRHRETCFEGDCCLSAQVDLFWWWILFVCTGRLVLMVNIWKLNGLGDDCTSSAVYDWYCLSAQGVDQSSCGSSCWSSWRTSHANISSPGQAMAGSSSSPTQMRWLDDGASAKTSPRWIMRNCHEVCATTTTRTSFTRQQESATSIASFATSTACWGSHQRSCSRPVTSSLRKTRKMSEKTTAGRLVHSYCTPAGGCFLLFILWNVHAKLVWAFRGFEWKRRKICWVRQVFRMVRDLVCYPGKTACFKDVSCVHWSLWLVRKTPECLISLVLEKTERDAMMLGGQLPWHWKRRLKETRRHWNLFHSEVGRRRFTSDPVLLGSVCVLVHQ